MDDRAVARGLAWFGIGLGVIELLMPARLARMTGLEGHERTLRLFGAREIASGALMLAAEEPERWLKLRVGGDVLDGALLASRLGFPNPGRARTLLALAAVAPIVALDVAVWLRARGRPADPDGTTPASRTQAV